MGNPVPLPENLRRPKPIAFRNPMLVGPSELTVGTPTARVKGLGFMVYGQGLRV